MSRLVFITLAERVHSPDGGEENPDSPDSARLSVAIAGRSMGVILSLPVETSATNGGFTAEFAEERRETKRGGAAQINLHRTYG